MNYNEEFKVKFLEVFMIFVIIVRGEIDFVKMKFLNCDNGFFFGVRCGY